MKTVNDIFSTNKMGAPADQSKSAQQSRKKDSTVNGTKFWELVWQSYALDPDEDHQVPLETRETIFYIKPSRSEIEMMRRWGHQKGFKLVAFNERFAHDFDEF